MNRLPPLCRTCLYYSQMPDGKSWRCCHANSPAFRIETLPDHHCVLHRARAADETTGADARALPSSPRQCPASPHHSGAAGHDGPGNIPQAGRSGPVRTDADGSRHLDMADGICCATCRHWTAEAGEAEEARCTLPAGLLTQSWEVCPAYQPPEPARLTSREDLLELVRSWCADQWVFEPEAGGNGG